MDILSVYKGVTTPLRDIIGQVEQLGWEMGRIEWSKDKFKASAKSPHGEEVKATGVTENTAAAHVLMQIARRHQIRTTAAQHFGGMWQTTWVDKLQQIAEAYAKAPVYDAKAAGAWKELAADSVARAKVLQAQLTVKVVDDPEPYANAQEMSEDIHKNKNFLVSRAHCNHPIWSVDENVAFRIVHDVLGHAVSGGDFGWHGENLACAAHFPLLSQSAQRALFTECFTPETLVRTENGFRPISEIQVGERVLSGDGTFQKVTQTFVRSHSGTIRELSTTSTLGKIRVTNEHPFLAVVGNHSRKSKKLLCTRTNCHQYPEAHGFEWIESRELTNDSYLKSVVSFAGEDILTIAPPHNPKARYAARKGSKEFELTDDMLWVIGMYLAEGSSGNGRLSFGLHKDEEIYFARLRDWFESHGYTTYCREVSENGIELSVNSTTLDEWWSAWLGRGCQNKVIPAELMNMPAERLAHLANGVMDGDGHYRKNVLIQTSSTLCLQMAEIAYRLGGQPGIKIRPKAGKKTVYELTEASAMHKVERRRGRRGHWELPDGNAVKVCSIEDVEYDGLVYDLSVEGEHTFVVQNLVVHNCIGQTGYAAFYRTFGPQKVAFMDEFLEPAQQAENAPAHTGIHPSQSFAPTAMPKVEPVTEPPKMDQGFIAPHMVDAITNAQPAPIFAKIAATQVDPNAGWSSGFGPQQGANAYLDMSVKAPDGRQVDPLDAEGVIENANIIDRQWYTWVTEDGKPDYPKMKTAVCNAFRVVLLSPRKDLRWNAVHYQDIAHIPGDEKDPVQYWNALEKSRQEWNARHRGEGERYAHLSFKEYLPQAKALIATWFPQKTQNDVDEYLNKMIYDWRVEEEYHVLGQDEGKDSETQRKANEIENKVNAKIGQRLKLMIADAKPELDMHHTAQDQMGFDVDIPIVPKVPKFAEEKYGAFMGTHLTAISQISEHADNILQAALQDVQEHDGAGHHFRTAVLKLEVSGVGPKVCSFAWLLLCPRTSQLGTIDTHMMDVLGHDYEKDMSNRDYFKYERQLAAGRDASGYGHVPLGTFQWGMWDYKRTGPGSHQDHSAMAVHEPLDHNHIDWVGKAQNLKGDDWHKQAPWWWQQTQEARDQVAKDYDAEFAGTVPRNKVPFKIQARFRNEKIAQPLNAGPIPWLELHGDIRTGKAGQTYASFIQMTLGIPAHEFWHLDHAALGRYHVEEDRVETVGGQPSDDLHQHLKEVLQPYNPDQFVA